MVEMNADGRRLYRKKADAIVLALSVVLAGVLLGIYCEVDWLIFFLTPPLMWLLLLLPSLQNNGKYTGATIVTSVFSAIMALLYVVMYWLEFTDLQIWGLPAGGGLFLYILWPFTVVGGGLAYAICFHYWLRRSDLGPEA